MLDRENLLSVISFVSGSSEDAILKQNKTASPKIGNKYQNELETARNAFKPI